jgi:hypothetical protein
VLYRGLQDRLVGAPGEWNLKACDNAECGPLWLDPRPAAEDLGRLYENYYTHADLEYPDTIVACAIMVDSLMIGRRDGKLQLARNR